MPLLRSIGTTLEMIKWEHSVLTLPFGLTGAVLHLFATTSMGIFMATLARTMPQFGLLLILVLLPLQILSGGMTPRESMPEFVQNIMQAAPTTHFISASRAMGPAQWEEMPKAAYDPSARPRTWAAIHDSTTPLMAETKAKGLSIIG